MIRLNLKKPRCFPMVRETGRISETRQATTRQEGKSSSSEERVSRVDSDGKLREVSRSVSKESESASGEKRNSLETYSVDVPGSARDGSLCTLLSAQPPPSALTQRVSKSPNSKSSSLNPAIRCRSKNHHINHRHGAPKDSGAQATRTVQVRDVNGSLGSYRFVDTHQVGRRSRHSRFRIAPSQKPK